MKATENSKQAKVMFLRMEEWVTSLTYFTEPARKEYGYNGSKTPVASNIINPPSATYEMQRRYVTLVLQAAQRLRSIKPPELAKTRVVAFVTWPKLFDSGVDVFFDPDYWNSFTTRNSADQVWTPLAVNESLSAQLNIDIPSGFIEHGYHFFNSDDSFKPPYTEEGQVWFYSESLPFDAA